MDQLNIFNHENTILDIQIAGFTYQMIAPYNSLLRQYYVLYREMLLLVLNLSANFNYLQICLL